MSRKYNRFVAFVVSGLLLAGLSSCGKSQTDEEKARILVAKFCKSFLKNREAPDLAAISKATLLDPRWLPLAEANVIVYQQTKNPDIDYMDGYRVVQGQAQARVLGACLGG